MVEVEERGGRKRVGCIAGGYVRLPITRDAQTLQIDGTGTKRSSTTVGTAR